MPLNGAARTFRVRAVVTHPAKRDLKMFTAFKSIFKAEPEFDPTLDLATAALNERVAHMFWKPGIEPHTPAREMKRVNLVKNDLASHRAIAA